MVKETLHIIMEFCDGGDLASRIRKQDGVHFEEDVILMWFTQIALAIRFCHKNHIIHRDIKSQNIFLTSQGIVKLGDFGIARVLNGTHELATSVVGTPFSMSPEVCENKPYSKPSDVWAMGCVLYEMCTLNHAFNANNLLGLVWKIVQKKHPPIPKKYSVELASLIDSMLEKDPRKRPVVKDILGKSYIKERSTKLIKFWRNGSRPSTRQASRSDLTSPTEKKLATLRRLNSRMRQRQASSDGLHGGGGGGGSSSPPMTSAGSPPKEGAAAAGLSKAELVKLQKQRRKEEEMRRYNIQAQKTLAENQKARAMARHRYMGEFAGSPLASPKIMFGSQDASGFDYKKKNNPFDPSPRAQSAVSFGGGQQPQQRPRVSSASSSRSTSHKSQSARSDYASSEPNIQIHARSNWNSSRNEALISPPIRRNNPYDERPAKASGHYSLDNQPVGAATGKGFLDLKSVVAELPSDDDYEEDDFTEDSSASSSSRVSRYPESSSARRNARGQANVENPSVSRQDRARNFRKKILGKFKKNSLDVQKFEELYACVKDKSGTDEMRGFIHEKFGKKYDGVAMEIEQLIYYEAINSINQ